MLNRAISSLISLIKKLSNFESQISFLSISAINSKSQTGNPNPLSKPLNSVNSQKKSNPKP